MVLQAAGTEFSSVEKVLRGCGLKATKTTLSVNSKGLYRSRTGGLGSILERDEMVFLVFVVGAGLEESWGFEPGWVQLGFCFCKSERN